MNKTLKIILVTVAILAVAFGYQRIFNKTYTCYDLAGQAYESDVDCTQWQS